MAESRSASTGQRVLGGVLVAIGDAVFAVRLMHEGSYAMPTGTTLAVGIAGMVLGGVLLVASAPRVLRWVALAASPVVIGFGLYATFAEFEEVVSLYATDSQGRTADLRLWIVDRDDGEWVGMPRWKALEHSLDGARVELLRNGTKRCVVPVLHEDRETVRQIHAMKVEKYAVARAAAAVGIYPSEARDTAVSLRLDPCPPQ